MILNAFRKNDEEQQRAQARVDAIVAAARAKSAAPELKRSVYRAPEQLPLVPSSDPIDQRIQEELATVRRMVEALGDELSNDPILLMRYQQSLQSVDLMAQTLGHLACVVGSADRHEAIDRIGMASLKARLTRGLVPDGVELHRTGANPFA